MSNGSAKVPSAADVLVVDDTAADLDLLADILARANYQTRLASNGELALRSAQTKPPALVLLDVGMPDMDGFEVCRRLKTNESTRYIPVIFLSALTEATDKAAGYEHGAVDYIAKPFHAEEVLARVQTHLALAAKQDQLAARNLQLQQANEQLESLYRAVGNGIVSVDERLRVRLFNFAAERMFGYSAADMIGQPLSVLLPERFRLEHEMHMNRFGAFGQSARTMGAYGEIYALRANGEEFPIEATVSQSGISPHRLFTVILNDITERRVSEQEREKLMRQLELLSERLAAAQEEERHKFAYELHEELGQELAALKIYLEMAGPDSGDTETNAHYNEALAVVVHAIERIRNLVMDIEPPALEGLGLNAAIHSYCKRRALTSGWNLRVEAPKPEARAPRDAERACFRVLQEALTNILQHAKATDVWVHLHQSTDELELEIGDNGVGFDCNAVRDDNRREGRNLGIFGMQIRAKHAGGFVEIKSTAGVGTEIRAVFPLSVAA